MSEQTSEQIARKWLARAEPNFADPEASEETLSYWSGVKAVTAELLQAAVEAQGRPRHECVCHFEDGLVQEWMAKVREVARSKGWRPSAEAQPLPAEERTAI